MTEQKWCKCPTNMISGAKSTACVGSLRCGAISGAPHLRPHKGPGVDLSMAECDCSRDPREDATSPTWCQ